MAGATLDFEPLAVDQAPGLEAEPDVTAIDQETPGLEAESGIETTGQEMHELQIDPEFRDLIPPLSQEEFEALKENLSTYGCRDRLTIWKGQNILLDGHHRYQICTELGIPFETKEIELPSKADAKIWIIKNQRGRRNLNESQRAMLAVKLEAIYSEKAKERMGTRTDLGQNLAQCEVGRSAEKAAEDMGISHQTVSFAKKVSTKGIPKLVRRVESADIAVSAASKIASLPSEIQEEIMGKIETQIEAGSNPKVAAIMHEIVASSQETPREADELMEMFRKKQEANLKLLQGIETSQRPENLVEMLAVAEKITAKLKEIETKSLDPDQSFPANCIIDADQFKTFLTSLEPISVDLKLRFEADGVKAITSDMIGYMVGEAFLPKESFIAYEELGEIGLPHTRKLLNIISLCSRNHVPGKKNLRLFIEPKDGVDVLGNLHIISGGQEFQYVLWKPGCVMDRRMPNPTCLNCELLVEGKSFVDDLKKAKIANDIGRFQVYDNAFSIVTESEPHNGVIVKPNCIIIKNSSVDSKFDIRSLMRIKRTIGKSKAVVLSLGVIEPMILNMAIDKIKIKYFIKEENPC